MSDTNKVTFGLSNVHYAVIQDPSGDGKPNWDTPVPIPGAVDWSPKSATNEVKFYADNGIYYGSYSNNGYTSDLEVAKIPDEMLTDIFRWIKDSIGGLVEVADMEAKPFALLAQVEGDAHARRLVYYHCVAGKPDQSHKTTEESKNPQTQKIPVTVTPVPILVGGEKRNIVHYALPKSDVAEEVYKNFFKEVYIPVTEIIPTP